MLRLLPPACKGGVVPQTGDAWHLWRSESTTLKCLGPLRCMQRCLPRIMNPEYERPKALLLVLTKAARVQGPCSGSLSRMMVDQYEAGNIPKPGWIQSAGLMGELREVCLGPALEGQPSQSLECACNSSSDRTSSCQDTIYTESPHICTYLGLHLFGDHEFVHARRLTAAGGAAGRCRGG